MPREECPQCGVMVRVPEDLLPGKRVRCPKCETVFAPLGADVREGSPGHRPASPSKAEVVEDHEEDEPPRRRKPTGKGIGFVLVCVFGGLAGLAALALIVWLFFLRTPALNINETFTLDRRGRNFVIDPISSERTLKVRAETEGGAIDLRILITEKTVGANIDELAVRDVRELKSETKATDLSLEKKVPANHTAIVTINASRIAKLPRVKLQITN